MPAKARGTRSAAPSASPAPKSTRSRSTRSDKTATTATDSDGDNDGSEHSGVPTVSEDEQGEAEAEAAEGETGDESDVKVPGEPDVEAQGSVAGKSSMSDRMAKMKELRNRMVCPYVPFVFIHVCAHFHPCQTIFVEREGERERPHGAIILTQN